MKLIRIALTCLFLAFSNAGYCGTITFDDILATGIGTDYTVVPNGYQGFDWNNFDVINTTGIPPSGLLNGAVSAPNVAYNALGNPSSFSDATPFILDSGYFTGAFRNGVTLEVVGLNGT